jgi:predicted metal-dependent phosphoesterase TrpH
MAVAGDTAMGRPHLAQALVQGGYVDSFEQAFARYLKRGGCAWVAKQTLTPLEAITVIHQAGGAAVVAHPTYGPSATELRAMIESGLDGIEVQHPLLTARDTERFTRLAQQCKLLRTGGSDYHGAGRSRCELGSLNVPIEAVAALRARHRRVMAGRA